MAPSTKAVRPQVSKKQTKISTFGKITKTAPATTSPKAHAAKLPPADRVTEPTDPCLGAGKKRRHDAIDGEENCDSGEQATTPFVKKPRLHPPRAGTSSQASAVSKASPVSSQSACTTLGSIDVPECSSTKSTTAAKLPASLKSVLALHEAFLKALSIHFAHNGLSSPAELGSLLKTITCLWKKHTVRKEDIQRMLALYEFSSEQDRGAVFHNGCNVSHKEGPFQLTASGAAGSMRVCVEYVGSRDMDVKGSLHSRFSENDLQYLFERDLVCLYGASRRKSNTHLAFLSGPLTEFPLLSCTIGTQSAVRQEKASAHRTELLSISNASHQRQQKKPVTQANSFHEAREKTDNDVALAVKLRTKSLFDRVAARQAVNASSSVPTAASIVRRHAVGRVSEIVEILRMKQQQKSVGRNHLLSNSNATSPTKLGQRVSFSMKQLHIEIRDSASVPIGDEEIRLCLEMLAEESTTAKWLKILESGVGDRKSSFVVLEGSGIPGRDVQKILQEKIV